MMHQQNSPLITDVSNGDFKCIWLELPGQSPDNELKLNVFFDGLCDLLFKAFNFIKHQNPSTKTKI